MTRSSPQTATHVEVPLDRGAVGGRGSFNVFHPSFPIGHHSIATLWA